MDSSIDISPAKVPLILASTEQWDKWYYYIKTAATSTQIWQYVDPKTGAERVNQEPKEPNVTDVNPDAITWSTLDAEEREYFRTLKDEYRVKWTEYQRKERFIRQLNLTILNSVDTNLWIVVRDAETPYQKLLALQNHMAPSTRGRERQIRQEYLALMHQKITNLDTWMIQWKKAHQDAQSINLPDIQGDRDLEDFLVAVEPFAPNFIHTVQTAIIQQTNNFTLLQIVEQFREAHRRAKTTEKRVNHSAFTGQQGDGLQGKRTPAEPCLCGQNHYWSDCFYLNNQKTPPQWFTRRQHIQDRIDKRFTNEQGLRERVDAHIESQNQRRKASFIKEVKASQEVIDDDEDTLGAYTTAVYSASRKYKLRKHWILDSGSDIHVTNNLDGYQETSTASIDDRLIAGATTYQIKSFGTIKVPVQTPTGQKSITLLHVAYIPTFMTNLVSLSKLVDKGLHWDTERGTLRKEGKDLCFIKKLGGHWTFTSTPLDIDTSGDEAGSAFSAIRAPKQASLTERHQILGHANHESQKHLQTTTKGATITSITRLDSYHSCQPSKVTQQDKSSTLDAVRQYLKKMNLCAQIGYLVVYNSMNQWRNWEARSRQIKSVRDVIFEDRGLYHPDNLPLPLLLEHVPEDEPILLEMPHAPHEEQERREIGVG
jgi:hypothetical protein